MPGVTPHLDVGCLAGGAGLSRNRSEPVALRAAVAPMRRMEICRAHRSSATCTPGGLAGRARVSGSRRIPAHHLALRARGRHTEAESGVVHPGEGGVRTQGRPFGHCLWQTGTGGHVENPDRDLQTAFCRRPGVKRGCPAAVRGLSPSPDLPVRFGGTRGCWARQRL